MHVDRLLLPNVLGDAADLVKRQVFGPRAANASIFLLNSPLGSAGGGLSGTYPNPNVVPEVANTILANRVFSTHPGHGWPPNDSGWPPGSGGSGTPGGADTNLQYNNASSFGGFADGSAHQVLHGGRTFSSVVEADITLANNTTNDVSTSAHGFAPKAPGDATKFLNGDNPPAYAIPTGGAGGTDTELQYNHSGTLSSVPGAAYASNFITFAETTDNKQFLVFSFISGTCYTQFNGINSNDPVPMLVIDFTNHRVRYYSGHASAILYEVDCENVKVAWFAVTPVGQQTGDIGTALSNYGLVVSPTLAYASLTGAPSALPPNGSAGGDLGGTYPNPSVTNKMAIGTAIGNSPVANKPLVADGSGNLAQVNSAADGTYNNPTSITIVDGIITAIS